MQKIKAHGDPVTPNTINVMLPQLTSNELILEISYLRAVACPGIKQRKRVKQPDGKMRMIQLPADVLRSSIMNAIKPESDLQDVDFILDQYFLNKKDVFC